MSILEEEEEQTVNTFGTHVDLQASIDAAKVGDIDILHGAEEIKYEDFEFLTTSDVNKLGNSNGWKNKKKGTSKKVERKSLFENSSLSSVFQLSDAIERFDLDKNGRLDEREQAALFRTIEKEMLTELNELHERRDHAGAFALNKRLGGLRGELEKLQQDFESSQFAEQRNRLATGAQSMQNSLRAKHSEHKVDLENRFQESINDLKARHAIETENLETEFMRERLPPTKHSKKYMELKSTERQLATGHVYRDAATLAKTIESMRGPEETKHYELWQTSQKRKRDKLLSKQKQEMKLLIQRHLVLAQHDRCAREEQEKINKKRLTIHQQNMAHVHLLEGRLKVELYDPPSMLRQKRPGYAATTSGLRGSQVEGAALRGGIASHDPRGRFAQSTLKFLQPDYPVHKLPPPAKLHGPEMPNLTDKHDFYAPLLSTQTTEWKTAGMIKRDAGSA